MKFKKNDIFYYEGMDYEDGSLQLKYIGIITYIDIGEFSYYFKVLHTFNNNTYFKGEKGNFKYGSSMYKKSKIISKEKMVAMII